MSRAPRICCVPFIKILTGLINQLPKIKAVFHPSCSCGGRRARLFEDNSLPLQGDDGQVGPRGQGSTHHDIPFQELGGRDGDGDPAGVLWAHVALEQTRRRSLCRLMI